LGGQPIFEQNSPRYGIPQDRLMAAFKEPEVVEEAKKTRLELETLSGAEVEAQIRDVMNQPREVTDRVKKLTQ
jgi:hypothetical protein